MEMLLSNGRWLPLIFVALMGISILIYVILDGYDLGVGILLRNGTTEEKDKMIASIGPFWDANETWLVLGVGILLVAFPVAHGIILTALYLPVALMLAGLILRGVAFDFRAKAEVAHKTTWDTVFFAGSLIAAITQGYMLGMYIVGFESGLHNMLFGLLCGMCLVAGYVLVGASWLIMKTEYVLQKKAIKWARYGLWGTAIGMGLISIVTPAVNYRVFMKWFSFPNIIFLAPIPLIAGMLILLVDYILRSLPRSQDQYCWVPFIGAVGIFILGFTGLAYSFFPYIVPERLTFWEAASSPDSLMIILIGASVVLPCIVGYTVFAYRVFWGKVQDLKYY